LKGIVQNAGQNGIILSLQFFFVGLGKKRNKRKLKKPSKTIFFVPIFVNAKPYFVKKPPTF